MQSTRSLRFACHILSCSVAVGVACGMAHAAHASDAQVLQGELASAETAIAVAAGEHAPRLTMLMARGATVWKNRADETLPERVEVHGSAQSVVWRLDRPASHFESKQIQLVYVTDSPRLKMVWQWRARASHGPLEHTLLIQNLSNESVWFPLQPSFRFDWEVDPKSALERFWVEKGADVPSSEGTHLDALHDGDAWQGTSSTYARPSPDRPREMIPYLLVDAPGGARQGWYVCIEFSGLTRITLQRNGDSLRGEAGLNPVPGPYRTRHVRNADDIHWRIQWWSGRRRQYRTALGASRAQQSAYAARSVLPADGQQQLGQRHEGG